MAISVNQSLQQTRFRVDRNPAIPPGSARACAFILRAHPQQTHESCLTPITTPSACWAACCGAEFYDNMRTAVDKAVATADPQRGWKFRLFNPPPRRLPCPMKKGGPKAALIARA